MRALHYVVVEVAQRWETSFCS